MSALPLPLSLRCFAAVLHVRAQAPNVVDLVQIARDWPRALAMRLLAALPMATAVASFQAIPCLRDAARVGQLLRAAGLDEATDAAIFKQLQALHAANPARAFTLRRAMEWTVQDTVFWPNRNGWPEDEAERIVAIALAAEQDWKRLPLPCIHRLPAPEDHPVRWPVHPAALPALDLPDSLSAIPNTPLRAAIEWLHLWRLDAGGADQIRSAIPQPMFAEWIAALDAATDPKVAIPLPKDIVLLEHLTDQHEDCLSLLEIDALLKGVSEPVDDHGDSVYDEEGRLMIRNAVTGWLKKAGIALPSRG